MAPQQGKKEKYIKEQYAFCVIMVKEFENGLGDIWNASKYSEGRYK